MYKVNNVCVQGGTSCNCDGCALSRGAAALILQGPASAWPLLVSKAIGDLFKLEFSARKGRKTCLTFLLSNKVLSPVLSSFKLERHPELGHQLGAEIQHKPAYIYRCHQASPSLSHTLVLRGLPEGALGLLYPRKYQVPSHHGAKRGSLRWGRSFPELEPGCS